MLLVAAVVAIGGCATVPKDYPRTASTAFPAHESTTVGREVAALAAQHPGQSGFAIIRRGRQAFTARVMLADLAEKSLDVQYYQWDQDATGTILAQHLLRAAQVIEYLDEGAGPEVSYRVQLDANGELYWTASDDGKPVRYDTDPLSTPGQRSKARFWSILPILEQL